VDPFAGTGGSPSGDPFSAPATIPSEYPKLEGLRTRLLLIAPTKYEQGIPSAFKDSNGVVQLQNRMTADVYVVDGGQVTGFDVTAFTSMYISNARLVDQLMKGFKEHFMILGRLDTFKPGTNAGAGNPWGLADPTEQDKQAARAYIAAGRRQPGEGPDGFPQQAPQSAPQFQQAPPQAAPAQNPWDQAAAPVTASGWGAPVTSNGNPFG